MGGAGGGEYSACKEAVLGSDVVVEVRVTFVP